MGLMIPNVKVNRVIYIPRTASHVLSEEFSLLETNPNYSNEHEDGKVMTRFLSTFDPLSKPKIKHSGFLSCLGNRDDSDAIHNTNQLIFHIHGGGFISMSSASHQVYSRKWAKKLKIPVFSIDYRLAPNNPYPDGLDDVWQAYCWVLNHAKDQLGINPTQIIVAGDSAGGNLALALTYKAILTGIKVPDGLLLSYPALNLAKCFYTPSMLLSLEDLLVPYTFLQLCQHSYIKDPSLDPSNDILISPNTASNEILRQMPPCRIIVGQKDPLSDDCWRFTEKLIDAGRDVKLKVYDGTPHGALNFCFTGGVKESNDVLKQSIEWLEELFLVQN